MSIGSGWCLLANTSFKAYNGEVPMSPKTTPIAPITRGIIGPRALLCVVKN